MPDRLPGATTRLASVAGHSLTAQGPLKLNWQRKPAPDCATSGAVEPFDPAKAVQPCDQLWLSFQTQSGRGLDISTLNFNAGFSITSLWLTQGLANRLATGNSSKAELQINPDSPPVEEDILVLAVCGEPGAARVDLTILADPTPTRSLSTKPARLLMIRQAMQISPAPQKDE